jgi:ADP-ribose pyrophosphatase YjhB (NUDIX family)
MKNTGKILKKKTKYRGPAFDVTAYEIRLEDELLKRDIIERKDGVIIVPVFDDFQVLLIREYCAGSNSYILSLPGGSLKRNEPPKAAALRELEEETGLVARKLIKLQYAFSHPSTSNRRSHAFLALGLMGVLRECASEHISPVKCSLVQAIKYVKRDFSSDVSTVGCLLLAQEVLRSRRHLS